ncbi:MAG TPA: ribonuclease III, partial [Candidatus Brachybacterium intestinipullorum]|nr:ribonuclease III [Candidatus Brachybacterium intestinipullorum]
SRLQEMAAAEGQTVAYRITESGLEHSKTFTATVTVQGLVTARGEGASKKDAELAAAQNAVRGLLAERGESLIPRG